MLNGPDVKGLAMRLGLAFKAFWASLTNRDVAARLERVLQGGEPPSLPEPGGHDVGRPLSDEPPKAPRSGTPVATAGRDSAITLLSALQREARLVDLVREDLGQYSDAQVGAAARPCLQHCAAVLERWFAPEPVVSAADGEIVEVPPDAPPTRFQWIGEGSASSGKVLHHGWQAGKVELPQWTGPETDVRVIAPAQVQSP